MVNSLSPSEPAGFASSTNNAFGVIMADPSPMVSNSAPSSFHGGKLDSSFNPSNTSTLKPSEIDRSSRQEKEMLSSGSGSDSQDECSSDCEHSDCDASWIELSALDVPNIDGVSITNKIDNMLTSLSKIDTSTSVGPSLNPGLVDLEQQLIQLKEDNIRLLSVLEATNDAMKKNLKYAQELKEELKSSQDEYDALKSSANNAITQLRTENERLKQRIVELENEVQENTGPVAYHQFDVPKEMNMQEMSSQIAARDIKISKLTGEVNSLTAQLERTRFDLSRSTSELSMNSSNQFSHQSQYQQQQMVTHSGNQPIMSSTAMSTGNNQYQIGSSNGASSNPNYNSNDNVQQNMMMEMNNLRSMIEQLRQEKLSLETLLSGKRSSRSRRHASKHGMGTSYTANANADNPNQFTNPNAMESDPAEPEHHGKHRRHHRNHGSRSARRLEKKLAKTAIPVINSAIMFKGFTTYSTQPQQ